MDRDSLIAKFQVLRKYHHFRGTDAELDETDTETLEMMYRTIISQMRHRELKQQFEVGLLAMPLFGGPEVVGLVQNFLGEVLGSELGPPEEKEFILNTFSEIKDKYPDPIFTENIEGILSRVPQEKGKTSEELKESFKVFQEKLQTHTADVLKQMGSSSEEVSPLEE